MKLDFANMFSKSVDLWRRARIGGSCEEVFENAENLMTQLSCFVESRLRQGILDLSAYQIFKNNAREQKVFAFTCFGFRVRLRVGAYFHNKEIHIYHLQLRLFDPSTRAACIISTDYALENEAYEFVRSANISDEGSEALFGLMELLSSSV